MIPRRFVNLVAENYKSGMYSLHRLDVSKHLFYPSTAEAVAAGAAVGNGGGRSPAIPRLQRLPPPCVNFQRSPTTTTDASQLGFFALVSPRSSEDRILCCNLVGNSVLYDAGSHSIETMPTIQVFAGVTPKTISTGRPGAVEEDLFLLHKDFNVLRFGSEDKLVYRPKGRKAWHWESLPPPPFDDIIGSHTVVDGGRTVPSASACHPPQMTSAATTPWNGAPTALTPWNGNGGKPAAGSFHLWVELSTSPTSSSGWAFPPPGPLTCARSTRDLSATEDLIAMEEPPTSHTLLDLEIPKNWAALRFKLLNLGGGRFCVARVFGEVERDKDDESDCFSDWDLETFGPEFGVLTGVELVTSSSSSGDNNDLEVLQMRLLFGNVIQEAVGMFSSVVMQ
ncbi:hypothetical protein BAE44_0013286 [Dichanthelium oligosanthes]|uniref:Uncharacterized protein n=1 Tax=Dichanthelium oligosanthes TaxID=888268 RepID=A0A1E5VKQ3_9POAL|nr:hypothetical protein BAE44_0013286 [Dichanthelium oligosanthes]